MTRIYSAYLRGTSLVPTFIALMIYLSACTCQTTIAPKLENITTPSLHETVPPITSSTTLRTKPLTSTEGPTTVTLTTKGSVKTTKAYEATERPSTVARNSKARAYVSTKGLMKSARKQKINATSSTLGTAYSSSRIQDRVGAVDCDLPVLPRESRLWRGNETHELNLPITECAGGRFGGDEECPQVIVSWEGSADIQSGDILIVRISDALLLDRSGHVEAKNESIHTNSSLAERTHHTPLQPAVYQVTRQGHEHCDVSEGMLLDINPLDEHESKIFTLYDKDLTEGVNLLIVVSENWGSQCVRLKVTVKSDNCGDSQDCSGKGVCYTNVSMEGYECQCCPGYMGPHCEDRDACNPSPCLNNGICVDLTQSLNGANYHCLCPYGFTGRKCEKDPCFSSPCLNGGSCMSMAMNGSTTFHCACTEDWTGTHCETPSTGGACADKPCGKGICVEQSDDVEGETYRCFCEPGYTGDKCELEYNECESSPCVNGGTCTDRVGGFTCACERGYTGPTCQIKVDLCSPNPCSEQRYCVDHGNSYSCECPQGFVGEECHIPATSICDNNPCAHGGTCWSGVDSFYCSCRPGYTGRLCEEDFILEPVLDGEGEGEAEGGGGSVRVMRLPLGLYHDRLHNVYIAAGTLGAAIAIVGVVVTACHCRVNKTYSRLLSGLARGPTRGAWGARGTRAAAPHWLQDKREPPAAAPAGPPAALQPPAFDTADMYYTLDFSDSQSSPLIQ